MTEKYQCLECFVAGKKSKAIDPDNSKVADFKKKFVDYENVKDKNWGSVHLAAKKFAELLCDVNTAGYHPEDVFSPDQACKVLTSFLLAGVKNENYLSEVFTTVYHCVRLSRKYHQRLYNERRFWCVLFEHILSLPDRQFFEGVMVFFLVIGQIFTDKTKRLCCSSYLIIVEDYLYLSGKFHPEKFFPIFKKLYELEDKHFTSKDTAFSLDYKKVVSPLFAPAVAEKEWYSLKQNRPVDFLVLLVHLFLTRPVILDLLLVNDPGIPILMSVLRDKSCKHVHAAIMFSVDAMLSIDSNDSRHELLLKLLKQLDYPLILNVAVYDDLHYFRVLAQKIILHTLRFLDAARKSGVTFSRPHKHDLLNVEYSKLKNMISLGGLDDEVFAFVVATERTENEREKIIKANFQDFAVRVLDTCDEKLSGCKKEMKNQLITCALNLLVSIGPLDEQKYFQLMKTYSVKCLSKFYNYADKDIKLLSRVCTVNMCQTSFDKKLELFKSIPLKSLVDEIYSLYQRNLRNDIKKLAYSQLMPVTVKLIHYDLCIMYHMETSGVLDKLQGERMRFLKMFQPETFGNMFVYINGENWTKMLDYVKADGLNKSAIAIDPELADKMMEVFVATVFDKLMPERYNTIAVACIAHLMHNDQLDVSKHVTDKLITEASSMYVDEISKFYLSDGGDFKAALENKRFSKLSIKDTGNTSRKKISKKTTTTTTHTTVITSVQIGAQKSDRSANGVTKKTGSCVKGKAKVTKPTPIKEPPKQVVDTQKELKKTPKMCALPSCPRSKPTEEIEAREGQRMKKCGKCRAVTYCGRECQTKHWNEHKKSCKEAL